MSAPLQHTPGPWQLVALGEANVYSVSRIVDGKDRWLISFRMNGELTTAQQMADVRLISAAPDLLEFAEWVLSLGTGGLIEGRARAAIAQARGLEGGAA